MGSRLFKVILKVQVWGGGTTEDGDYHKIMNGPAYFEYLEYRVLPAVKKAAGRRKPALVIDNAPYHSVRIGKVIFKTLLMFRFLIKIQIKQQLLLF